METWIRADFNFELQGAIIRIAKRDLYFLDIVASVRRENPADVANVLRAAIESARPDLKGGVLCGMTYRFDMNCFDVMYYHPSLPEVRLGCTLPIIPITPDESAPHVVGG